MQNAITLNATAEMMHRIGMLLYLICLFWLPSKLVIGQAIQLQDPQQHHLHISKEQERVDFYPPLFYGTTWGREIHRVSKLRFRSVGFHAFVPADSQCTRAS